MSAQKWHVSSERHAALPLPGGARRPPLHINHWGAKQCSLGPWQETIIIIFNFRADILEWRQLTTKVPLELEERVFWNSHTMNFQHGPFSGGWRGSGDPLKRGRTWRKRLFSRDLDILSEILEIQNLEMRKDPFAMTVDSSISSVHSSGAMTWHLYVLR